MRLSRLTGSKSDAGRSGSPRIAGILPGVPGRRSVSKMPRCFATAFLCVLPILAQSPGAPTPLTGVPGQPGPRFPRDQSSNPSNPATVDQNRIKSLNRLRQKAIVDDTTKLLMLARELNAQGSIMSSAERVHKAAEIEKLAKSVKEKMSYAVGDTPSAPSSFTVLP
jgi:hypothetical protein